MSHNRHHWRARHRIADNGLAGLFRRLRALFARPFASDRPSIRRL